MKNLFDLTGKVAVVVGGGGGLGEAIARGFAQHGASVVITARNMANLERAAAEIKELTGSDVACMTVDAANHESIKALRDNVVKKFGTVDILVNSQGFNKKYETFETEENIELWDSMFDVNVRGMMLCCVEFGKVMAEKNYGKIINISSIRGSRSLKIGGNLGYGTTKGAVDMMTKYLAGEWGKHNITVNAIGPIVTLTPMMTKPGMLAADVMERFKSMVPMGRLGEPEDCIGPALFLASDASSFVSGQVIYPDGGLWCV
jgi:gluconate 5-dehydrogenase